jgi:hypothetical protein
MLDERYDFLVPSCRSDFSEEMAFCFSFYDDDTFLLRSSYNYLGSVLYKLHNCHGPSPRAFREKKPLNRLRLICATKAIFLQCRPIYMCYKLSTSKFDDRICHKEFKSNG